jgi:hypothetical protein
MGNTITAAHDPSVADYRATSPRLRAGRNMRSTFEDVCPRSRAAAQRSNAPGLREYIPSSHFS